MLEDRNTDPTEKRLTSFWIWFNVFVIIIASCFSIAFWFFRYKFRRQKLTGNILITNGESALSKEIYHQLISNHECSVIMIIDDKNCTDLNLDLSKSKIVNCDLKNSLMVKSLSNILTQEIGPIDIIVDNGKQSNDFIQQTSENLINFLNILMHFVPKMIKKGDGHIVSIRNSKNSMFSMINSRYEIYEFLDTLCPSSSYDDNNNTFQENQPKLLISSVLCELPVKNMDNNILDINLSQIAETIINGIQSREEIIEVKTQRNIFKYLANKVKLRFELIFNKNSREN